VFGLIFLAISVPNENPPEEGPDVKYGQFAEVSGTNDYLEDLANFQNLGYYNGDYYFAGVEGENFLIYKCTGLTGTTSTLHTYNMSAHAGIGTYTSTISIICRVVKTNSDWFVIAAISFADATPDYAVYVGIYNITDDNAWIDMSASDGSGTKISLVDAFVLDDTDDKIQMLGYEVPSVGDDDLILWDVDESLETAVAADKETIGTDIDDNGVYMGCMVDSTYWFMVDEGASQYLWYITSADEITRSDEITGTTSPTSLNRKVQLYNRKKNQEFIIDEDHFYYRMIGDSTWSSVSDTGTTTNGIVWAYNQDDQYVINWIIWKDSIYKVFAGGGIAKIQTYTGNAYVGWDDWFANGADKIYQLDP